MCTSRPWPPGRALSASWLNCSRRHKTRHTGTFHKLVPGELIEGYEAIGEELAEAHGMEAGSYFLNRTSFEKIDESTTRVTITQGPLDPAMHEMSVAGWKSSFNKLNRVLAA
nr:SRPBCC domain-containing protein [Rothia nasimurium]